MKQSQPTVRRLRGLIDRANRALSRWEETSPFDVFLTAAALDINQRRQEHLDSLGLPIAGTSVLELGAGIGLHTPFFHARGCRVTSTDGNQQNLAELARRLPGADVRYFDLETGESSLLGVYDVVYCYGLLYHLSDPAAAIAKASKMSGQFLLLETCVSLGDIDYCVRVRDFAGNNQATSSIGCRPSRPWLMRTLREHWDYVYATTTQPRHDDFENDWCLPLPRFNHRAVFVASRSPLDLPTLTCSLPERQPRH